jgi:hypothetical protein
VGVWGTGLYSGDFAMDLRGTIRAVSRLPLAPDRLTEILSQSQPGPANDPANEDHTTFWLVLADQFSKRGIDSARARNTALAIIDDGTDLTTREGLGATAADTRKQPGGSRSTAHPTPRSHRRHAAALPARWLNPSIGTSVAVEDRSIANEIEARPPQKFQPTVLGIDQLLRL